MATFWLQTSRPWRAPSVFPNNFRRCLVVAPAPRPRPAPIPYRYALSRNSSTGEAGENKSGHIAAGPHEGILFFDSQATYASENTLWMCLANAFSDVFPMRLKWTLLLPLGLEKSLPELMKRYNSPKLAAIDPINIIKRGIPPKIPIKISEILPRLKDGGAFVKFSYPDGLAPQEIEGTLKGYLKETPIKPWFNPFRRVRAALVRGSPWLEDLSRFPSQRLKVEFVPTAPGREAAELSQERLYSIFRPFGKMAEIRPQPADSKILPRYAFMDYSRMRYAIMAKNCMHAFAVPESEGGGPGGTVLRLGYERVVKAHWIWDWLVNHPRIVLPAVAAVVATITVAIFDP